MPDKELGHAVPLEDALGWTEQPLSDAERELVDKAKALFEEFRVQNSEYHKRAAICRKIYRLEDPEQDAPGVPSEARAPQLHTLKSTVVACVADQMDNTPEAVLLPERSDLTGVAESLTDITRYIMERNGYDRLHLTIANDYYQTGTAVVQVAWDEDMSHGAGDVAFIRCPIENLYWDPLADDIQEGRAVFKANLRPRSWYAEHFPDEAQYIQGDPYAWEDRVDSGASTILDSKDDEITLIEYWYRRYDAKTRKHNVHVSYIAGGALLYCSEREMPGGVYEHGKYPFIVYAYTPIEGQPVGNGMVWEFREMQRYINRYAKYIDENARMSAKIRLLVRQDSGLEEEDLTDWNKAVIRGKAIGEESVRWFQSAGLSGQVNAQMGSFEQQIKLDSGQNQFSRGEGGMGITAASAIAALQEAGGKTSRLHTASLNHGFREIVEQTVWLIAQHYGEERVVRITGRLSVTGKDAERKLSGADVLGAKSGGKKPETLPYLVQVQVQRRNPMRVQAHNELVMQMYQIAGQAGQLFSPAKLLELMQVDGKDRLLPVLREVDETHQKMRELEARTAQAEAASVQMQAQMESQSQEMINLRRIAAEQNRALNGGGQPAQAPVLAEAMPQGGAA